MRMAIVSVLTTAFSIALGAAHASARAGTINSLSIAQVESIDTFVSSEMARQQIPGVAIGIYNHGHILLAKGYGLADVELSVPVRPTLSCRLRRR
jgi:CubicO group peptidase (beta-lactamase class C family)